MPDFYSPLRTFEWGGGADEHGKRAIGNWWSDNAVDLMAAPLAVVFAIEDLTVTSVTRRASNGRGVEDGSTVFARGRSGEEYAFLHLDPGLLPIVGQKLNANQPFARLGAITAGGPHLHLGTKSADPTALVKSAQAGKPVAADGSAGQWGGDKPPRGDGTNVPGLGDPVGAIRSVGDFLGAITNPHNILRGLQVVAGAVLILAGVMLLARQVALAADVPALPIPGRAG